MREIVPVKFLFFFTISFFLVASCKSQENTKIFVVENQLKDFNNLSNKYDLGSIKIIGASMIDPGQKGIIDYPTLERYLGIIIPDKNDSSILCIDIENKIYHNLKEARSSVSSVKEFIKIIDFIKEKRPFIKLGFYGLPFTVYYDAQLKINRKEILNEVLSKVDVIFPSLYVQYPKEEKGIKSNFSYFKVNLDNALFFSKKYDKKIMPFFWFLVHPSNKRYGYAILPKAEVNEYLKYIVDYLKEHDSFSGIVIWNSNTPFRLKEEKYDLVPDEELNYSVDKLFKNYIDSIYD